MSKIDKDYHPTSEEGYKADEDDLVSASEYSAVLYNFESMRLALKDIALGQQPIDYGRPQVTIDRLQSIAINVLDNLKT